MTPLLRQTRFAAIGVAILGAVVGAQQPAPGSAAFAPEVGQAAPEFSLPGGTRYGVLKNPVKLSDYRGQTVVIAFFPKARTKG